MPGIFSITPIITVAWSLSYEFFFYLAMPALVAGLAMRRRTAATRLALVAALAFVYTAGHALGLPYQPFVLFMAGMLVYDATQLDWQARHVRALESLVVVLAVVAVPLLYAIEIRPALLAPVLGSSRAAVGMLRTVLLVTLFASLVFTCLMPGTRGGRLFSWTPIRWLGNMSYSYYLLHALTINFVAMLCAALVSGRPGITGDLAYWLLLPVTFVLSLITSTVLFAVVERPLSLRDGRPPREDAAAGIPATTLAPGA